MKPKFLILTPTVQGIHQSNEPYLRIQLAPYFIVGPGRGFYPEGFSTYAKLSPVSKNGWIIDNFRLKGAPIVKGKASRAYYRFYQAPTWKTCCANAAE